MYNHLGGIFMLREQIQLVVELDSETLSKYGISLNEANQLIKQSWTSDGLQQLSNNFYTVSKDILSIVEVTVLVQKFTRQNDWFKPSLKILTINQTLESSNLLNYL